MLNCLEKGGGGVLRNAVDIWISVSKLCLKMMAADLRKPVLDPSACVLRSPSLSITPQGCRFLSMKLFFSSLCKLFSLTGSYKEKEKNIFSLL